uniref:G_PROTEIN_RECEP_F1_2 domain-containing protein n=1 Tax=Anisakis simplex TaxID=6269 RepID=A0A0M3J1W4_ANISI
LVIKSTSVSTNGISSVHEQERKMTITVVAIISCFTITQMPSALLFLYEKLINDAKTQAFATVSSITNFLVLTGKMLNVVLFCLTSISFRYRYYYYYRLIFEQKRKFPLNSDRCNHLRHHNNCNDFFSLFLCFIVNVTFVSDYLKLRLWS